jgi:TonB family protein
VLSVRRVVGRAILLLIQASLALGQNLPQPRLISAQLPTYPAIARAARIEGDVKVEFVLNASGEPVRAAAVSGPPLLRHAAEENVMSWRFELPKDLYRSEWSYSTTFHFKISVDEDPYYTAKLTVVENSFRDVEIITNRPSNKYAENCPSDEEAQPPISVKSGDFVKLSRSQCYGTCPAYEVTVSETGDITWNGIAYVASTGVSHSRIDPGAARALIQQFLLPKFWALCGDYSASITDNPTTEIQVQIGDRSKTVSNYANSAPDWVATFEDAIDAAANTHLWRHGEPGDEPLSNIFQDAWLPKPGVTPLMRAAASANINSMKAALASGVDVDAPDSSGWTALMYAAASSHSEPVQLLLKAGANPNHNSPSGDTPLLASAIAGQFDEDLFRAGAIVDVRNAQGVTVLMILAAKGEADGVRDALRSGADPLTKDAKGRSALEYLRLANCGESPIVEWKFGDTGGECDHLDLDDVRQVASVLKNAKRKPKE